MTITQDILSLRQVENRTLADIVRKVSYVDEKNIYKSEGYSSIYAYLTQCLGYSNGSAIRRMKVARYLAKHPETYEMLRDGRITVCAVLEIADIKEEVPDLLSKIEGKSKLEAQKIAAEFLPAVTPKREVIKPLMVTKSVVSDSLFCSAPTIQVPQELSYLISIQASEKCIKLLNQVKVLVGPKSTSEIFEKVLEDFIKRSELKRKGTFGNKKKRHVTKTLRHAVSQRDNHQCTFMSKNGDRCTETHSLQVDHIKPFAIGGETEIDNLRLLCPTHNRFYAEQQFGNHLHLRSKSETKNFEKSSSNQVATTS